MSTDAENGSLEDDLIPVLYADEHFDKEIVFRIVDRTSFEIDVSSGFDPYNTASMYKKK
jgi:hypothetical protein